MRKRQRANGKVRRLMSGDIPSRDLSDRCGIKTLSNQPTARPWHGNLE